MMNKKNKCPVHKVYRVRVDLRKDYTLSGCNVSFILVTYRSEENNFSVTLIAI